VAVTIVAVAIEEALEQVVLIVVEIIAVEQVQQEVEEDKNYRFYKVAKHVTTQTY
jgi:hypothetical protein